VTDAHDLVTSYLQWHRQNITVRDVDGWVQITAPFLDRHNDHIQIYVRSDGDNFILTDDGYIINDLLASGCDVSTPRRRELLDQIIRGFGVHIADDELTTQATKATFAQRKHALLQAMVSVNDLFFTSRSTVRGLFLEEVEQFLVQNQIRFVPFMQAAGRTDLSHTFDYVIPAWGKVPERILRAINSPTKEKVQSMLFAWSDVRDIRKGENGRHGALPL